MRLYTGGNICRDAYLRLFLFIGTPPRHFERSVAIPDLTGDEHCIVRYLSLRDYHPSINSGQALLRSHTLLSPRNDVLEWISKPGSYTHVTCIIFK